MSVNKRKFSKDFKIKVISEVEAGLKTRAEATREYELSEGLLGKWLQKYREDPENAFIGKGNGSQGYLNERRLKDKINNLEAALGRKTYENEILKQTVEKLSQKKGICLR